MEQYERKHQLIQTLVDDLGLSNDTYQFLAKTVSDVNDVFFQKDNVLQTSANTMLLLDDAQTKYVVNLLREFHLQNEIIAKKEADAEATKTLAERTSQFASVLGSTNLGQINAIKSTIAMIEANRETIGTTEEVTAALKKLNEQLKELETSQLSTTVEDQANMLNMAAGAVNTLSSAFKTLADNEATAEQKLKSFITGIGGLMQIIGGATKNPLLGGAGALVSAIGGAIAHTGGLIHNNGVQRFATGGIVQGQDNVPIMAQAGEFVMRRSAVQNIGVQNLADMNRTGNTSSGLTINIAGDMIGNEDHVRTKVLPFIKNELRREANA